MPPMCDQKTTIGPTVSQSLITQGPLGCGNIDRIAYVCYPTLFSARKYIAGRFFRGKILYFREKIFSREDIFAGRYFTREDIFA